MANLLAFKWLLRNGTIKISLMDWKDYQIKGICCISPMLCTRLTTKKGGTKLVEFFFRGVGGRRDCCLFTGGLKYEQSANNRRNEVNFL